MNIPTIPADWTPFLNQADESFSLSIVIVYNDMSAAMRAAQMVERLGKKFHGKMEPRLQPLPLNHLADEGCYDRSLSDAMVADMIIISISGSGALPDELKQWVKQATTQRPDADAAMVALLGSTGEMDAPDSARFRYLQNAAHTAGLDFFSPRRPERVKTETEVFEALEVVG